MHRQRWITGLIAVPLLLLVILKGGRFGFVLVMLLVSGLGQWELLAMLTPESDTARRLKAIILGSVLLLSFCTAHRLYFSLCDPSSTLFVLVLSLFILFLFYLLSYGHIPDLNRDLMVNTLGLLYLPFLLGHFVWLRHLPQGEWWVICLLAVTFAGDTAAFYGGRTWGRRKLFPQVSPGKTWAGAVAGGAAYLAVGVLGGSWLLPGMSLLALGWLALVLALLGMLGDLFESMLKRQAQVKDASQLLPGHGGMLDRLDSLLFAAPAVVYVRLFLFGG